METLDVTFDLILEPEEDMPGDHFEDDETLKWVYEQRASGNEWAWFCAHVVARTEVDGVPFEAHDYLGSCSYESERDFRDTAFKDMCDSALEDLREKIETHRAKNRLRGVLREASEKQ